MGIFTAVGSDAQRYQAFEMNLAPTPDSLKVFVGGAGSVHATLGDFELQIFDDNIDGVYGGQTYAYAKLGMQDGGFDYVCDSVLLKGAKRALPWSGYQQLGKDWYRVESIAGGAQIKATPVNLITGRAKLSFKGGKPDFLIVEGMQDRVAGCFFDLTAGGSKGVELPIGLYRLHSGRLSQGKRADVIKSLIMPGNRDVTLKVEEGKTATLKLGAPFNFDFIANTAGEELVVQGRSIMLVGVGGETYQRHWNVMLQPEVSMRAAGGRKGSKPKKMGLVTDASQVSAGWQVPWYPLDLALPLGKLKGDVEVQLTMKKNKLFGSKLSSPWKKAN